MMSRVTSIVVRPAAGAVARAALGTVEITAASCAAHWLAAGMLPSVTWVLASALPIFGIGVLLQRGRMSLPMALTGAAAGQVFLHLALAEGMSADHMHPSGTIWPMVAAHAAGALATVVLWSMRRRAWDVLVRVNQLRVPAMRRAAHRSINSVVMVDAWLEWMASRRRGPPVLVGN
jgi:hypothetical protein